MEREYATALEVQQLRDDLEDLKNKVDKMKKIEPEVKHDCDCPLYSCEDPEDYEACACGKSFEAKVLAKVDEIKKQQVAAKYLDQEAQRHLDMAADARSEYNCVEEALRTLKADLLKMLGE
jgi:hypothetical protein